jgi:hypothetical protein
VFDQVAQRRQAGRHRQLIAAKGAGVGARLPRIQVFVVDHDGQRQAAADGLGEHHHIGLDAGVLQGIELAGATPAGLDLVQDQCKAPRVGP